jgi:hypothetical protein
MDHKDIHFASLYTTVLHTWTCFELRHLSYSHVISKFILSLAAVRIAVLCRLFLQTLRAQDALKVNNNKLYALKTYFYYLVLTILLGILYYVCFNFICLVICFVIGLYLHFLRCVYIFIFLVL